MMGRLYYPVVHLGVVLAVCAQIHTAYASTSKGAHQKLNSPIRHPLDRVLVEAKESVKKCQEAEKEIYRLVDLINEMRNTGSVTVEDAKYLHALADKHRVAKNNPYYIVYELLNHHKKLFKAHLKTLKVAFIWFQIGGALLKDAGRPVAKRHFLASQQEIQDVEKYLKTLETYIKLLPKPLP